MKPITKRGTVSDEFLHIIGLVLIPAALFILMMAVVVREGADTKYFAIYEVKDLANVADAVLSTTGTVIVQYTSLGTTIDTKKGFIHDIEANQILITTTKGSAERFSVLLPTTKTWSDSFTSEQNTVVTLLSDSDSLSLMGSSSATLAHRQVSIYQQDCGTVKDSKILISGTGPISTFAKQQFGTSGSTKIQLTEKTDSVRSILIIYSDKSKGVACLLNNALAKHLNKFGGTHTPISLVSVQSYPAVLTEELSDSSISILFSGAFTNDYAAIVQSLQEVHNG